MLPETFSATVVQDVPGQQEGQSTSGASGSAGPEQLTQPESEAWRGALPARHVKIFKEVAPSDYADWETTKDKFKTLRAIRAGNTRERVLMFENL